MKEDMIKEWFHAWFHAEWKRFDALFENDVYYSESWCPEYNGIKEISIWFENWHRHSELVAWDIKQFFHSGNYTIVEWYFSCKDNNSINEFDGCSIIEWSEHNKIKSIKEYSSSLPKYNAMMKNK